MALIDPKQIISIAEAAGHQLVRDAEGLVVMDAFEDPEENWHSGPACKVCGHGWCLHCFDLGWETIARCKGAKP